MNVPDYCGTRIDAQPTFSGARGRAWRVTLPPVGERRRRDEEGTVGMFIVQASGAHPLWDHWFVTLIHLRPIEGVKPAHIRQEGATHEFMIASADPTAPLPGLVIDGPEWRPRWLTPIDVVEQFAATDDVVADRILELAVRAIVDGVASPDQDWRPWWKNAIATTAEHYHSGIHETGSRS